MRWRPGARPPCEISLLECRGDGDEAERGEGDEAERGEGDEAELGDTGPPARLKDVSGAKPPRFRSGIVANESDGVSPDVSPRRSVVIVRSAFRLRVS